MQSRKAEAGEKAKRIKISFENLCGMLKNVFSN